MLDVKPVEDNLSLDPEFQQWVRGLLNDDEVRNLCVTFTKTDGSERTIRGTTAESLIPIDKRPKGTGGVVTKQTQRLFDLDKQEWRSFKWESVKQISFNVGGDDD